MSIREFAAKLSVTPVPWYFARTISWFLAINGLVTAWDYLHPPTIKLPGTSRALTIVELIASLHTWGIAFLIASAVLTLGLATRRHSAVWLGHLLSAGMFAMFTIATTQSVWTYAHTPAAEQLGSVWRAVTQSLVITILHVILCIIRGPVPRKGDEQ